MHQWTNVFCRTSRRAPWTGMGHAIVPTLILVLLSACADRPVTLLIRDVRVVDGNGGVVDSATILVEGNRIRAIQEVDGTADGTTIIDGRGLTALPGFIDTHLHVGAYSRISDAASLEAWKSGDAGETLTNIIEAGVTTVLDPGDYFPAIRAVSMSVESGALPGPRIRFVGPAFTALGGHPAATVCRKNALCRSSVTREFDSTVGVGEAVLQVAEADGAAIKVVYGPSPRELPTMSDEVLAEIGAQSERNGLRVLAHIPFADAVGRAMNLGVDGLVHTPWVGKLENADAMREREIPVSSTVGLFAPISLPDGTVTDSFGRPLNETYQQQIVENLGILAKAGVTIAFGTDNPIARKYDDAVRSEIETMNKVLSTDQVIAAMTRDAARYLELDDDLGTLEEGKIADIVLISGDPMENLEDLGNVIVVIQGGKITVDKRP